MEEIAYVYVGSGEKFKFLVTSYVYDSRHSSTHRFSGSHHCELTRVDSYKKEDSSDIWIVNRHRVSSKFSWQLNCSYYTISRTKMMIDANVLRPVGRELSLPGAASIVIDDALVKSVKSGPEKPVRDAVVERLVIVLEQDERIHREVVRRERFEHFLHIHDFMLRLKTKRLWLKKF